MNDFEDRDVKIFSKKLKIEDSESLIRLAEETAAQRNNGNVAKAVALGDKIAGFIFDINTIDDDDFKNLLKSDLLDDKVLYQVRLLLTFAAESTVHRSLSVPLLSTTVVNTMYDRLMECNADFYEDTTDAFTFYYVAFRKHDRTVHRIGRRFAMLCAKEGDEEFEKFGSDVYVALCRMICREIEKSEFILE